MPPVVVARLLTLGQARVFLLLCACLFLLSVRRRPPPLALPLPRSSRVPPRFFRFFALLLEGSAAAVFPGFTDDAFFLAMGNSHPRDSSNLPRRRSLEQLRPPPAPPSRTCGHREEHMGGRPSGGAEGCGGLTVSRSSRCLPIFVARVRPALLFRVAEQRTASGVSVWDMACLASSTSSSSPTTRASGVAVVPPPPRRGQGRAGKIARSQVKEVETRDSGFKRTGMNWRIYKLIVQ